MLLQVIIIDLFNISNKMKTAITALLLIFTTGICISQNLVYEIRGKHTQGVSKEKLNTAKSMMDIRPGYPASMIDSYISTEISVTIAGKVLKATGRNEVLTAEQQKLIQKAEIGSEVSVEIGYVHPNPATLIPDIHKMHFAMSVVPEVEASYPGGYQDLMTYLEKNVIDKINQSFPKEARNTVITFTVSESGKITKAKVSETSTDPVMDIFLLEVISKMPNWVPARNADGVNISQDFVFTLGNGC